MKRLFIIAVALIIATSNTIDAAQPKDSDVSAAPKSPRAATAPVTTNASTSSSSASSEAAASNASKSSTAIAPIIIDDAVDGEIDATTIEQRQRQRSVVLHRGNNKQRQIGNTFQLNIGGGSAHDTRTFEQKQQALHHDLTLMKEAEQTMREHEQKTREQRLKDKKEADVAEAKTQAEIDRLTLPEQLILIEQQQIAISRARIKAELEAERERTFGSVLRKATLGGIEKGLADGIAQPIAQGLTIGAVALFFKAYDQIYPGVRLAGEKAEAQKENLLFGLKLSEQQSRILHNEGLALKSLSDSVKTAREGANPKIAAALNEQFTMMLAMQMQKQMIASQMSMQNESAEETEQASTAKTSDKAGNLLAPAASTPEKIDLKAGA